MLITLLEVSNKNFVYDLKKLFETSSTPLKSKIKRTLSSSALMFNNMFSNMFPQENVGLTVDSFK